MALISGANLGPYTITAELGKGGMGEVYRALDTNLGREVAIKILPDAFARDPERLARFEREARTLATLNHPHIAHIYGFEKSGDVRALVMELVEGPTLADRIQQGPISAAEAEPIARQLAEALEAAHQLGIVHRDLKPANIKLRSDGTVKVLDFGLAKMLDPIPGSAVDGGTPTITSPAMTAAGVLLGTAAYMSPEQARGLPVDRRADIWAFGCVLFEMLTARRAFEAPDVALTLSQVLQREPALSELPGDVPARLKTLIALCLRKSLPDRMSDAGAARLMLDGAFETAAPDRARVGTSPGWRRALPFAVTAVIALAAGAMAMRRWASAPPADPRPVVRFAVPASPSLAPRAAGIGRHILAISPEGTRFVYWADDKLHLRTFGALDDTVVAGSEDAREPFFSSDGRWLAFWRHGQLLRCPVDGGAAIPLAATLNPWGITWDADDVIRYGQGAEGLWQVSARGGTPTRVIAVREGEAAHGPQLLPGGDWLLFTLRPAGKDSWDEAQIVAQSVTTGERVVLIDRGRDARYIPTGHLVYGLNGTLLAVPFDATARRVTGQVVPLVEGVMDSDVRTGAMQFAVSKQGTLVYLSGLSGQRARLMWLNRRDGSAVAVPGEALPYSSPRVSPDATRVAVEVSGRDGIDIHVFDLQRHTLTRVTPASSHGRYPLWSPDGRRIVFYSDADGGGLYSINADGIGPVKRLTTSRAFQMPSSWAHDGDSLLMVQRSADQIGAADIYLLSGEASPPTPLVQTSGADEQPAVSPDGRWLAYSNHEPGADADVFVQPFPRVEANRWLISTEGGDSPVWSRDGRQLFFISRGRAMSVSIESTPTFRAGTPVVMFSLPPFYKSQLRGPIREWDLAPDGERFLIVNPGDVATNERSQFIVVLNWYEDLKRLVK